MIKEKSKGSLHELEKSLRNKKRIIQIIPKTLSKLLILNNKVVYDGEKLKTDNIATICNMLLNKFNQNKGSFDANIVVLNSTILQKRFGCKYRFYFRFLEELCYIKRIGTYKNGEYSYKFKLLDKFKKSSFIQYVNNDKVCLKKYKIGVLSGIKNKKGISNDILKGLKFNSVGKIPDYIDIDIREKLILDLYNVTIDYNESMEYVSHIKDDISRIFNELHVMNIKDKHIWYQFDRYGRFHSNYTILKRHIRENYLKINGEYIEEIDVRNSQPLLLSKIIKDSDMIGNIVDENEFETFLELVKNGKLYQHFIDVYGYENKKDVKRNLIYKVLFGDNKKPLNKANRTFKAAFPTIYEFIKVYKQAKGNYKSLSHELQRIESNLIFKKIVKEIKDKDQSISIFTVHDSICFPKSDKILVEEIFNKHLYSLINSI